MPTYEFRVPGVKMIDTSTEPPTEIAVKDLVLVIEETDVIAAAYQFPVAFTGLAFAGARYESPGT